MGKITIKNVCDSWVSIFVPEANFSREIPAGREIPIPDDTYNALTFDQGFMNLVNMHYIQILGVPEEEAILPSSEVVVSKDEISKMLDDLDITTFAKFIPNAAPAEKETVVDLAVEKKITHSGFVNLIKKYCGRDVIDLIHTKHLEED
jgi:hypothetical protein